MRLVAYEQEGRAVLGAKVGDAVVRLSDVVPGLPQDVNLAIGALDLPGSASALQAKLPGAPSRPLAGLTLLPVVPRPGKIV